MTEKPCKGQNTNVCVAEGCYGEACTQPRLDATVWREAVKLAADARKTLIGELNSLPVGSRIEFVCNERTAKTLRATLLEPPTLVGPRQHDSTWVVHDRTLLPATRLVDQFIRGKIKLIPVL